MNYETEAAFVAGLATGVIGLLVVVLVWTVLKACL